MIDARTRSLWELVELKGFIEFGARGTKENFS